MTVAQTDLFNEVTQKLSLVDITFELPEGFREQDTLPDKIAATKTVIKNYLSEGWALFDAYSGGKDSSVKLAIVLNAMKEFIEENGYDNCPPLAIMHSDTLLENPVIAQHTHSEIRQIRAYAALHNLPVTVHIATPSLSENYLVNIIGGRTIASTAQTKSRKCAMMMKVDPITRMKTKILKAFEKDYEDKVLTLVGKRYDESEARKNDMIANGEVPHKHFTRNDESILSPIAHFTLDDVFFFIGYVTNGEIECYSDFESLIDTYRAANGGECMVNAIEGNASSSGCGARYGCHICLHTKDDKSMEVMIQDEKYDFMRNLWAFRNYLQACHNDPAKRTWLARSVNKDGTIDIKPNSYSPEFTEELLRMALSIQVLEEEAAFELGIAPRFQLVTFDMVMAIEMQWCRYGYHRGLEALRIWKEVNDEGKLKLPPEDLSDLPRFPLLNDVPQTSVPFMDEYYDGIESGFRDLSAMVADIEDTVEKSNGQLYANVRISDEFSMDPESLDMFLEFELDYALRTYNDRHYAPAAALHYLMRYGVVSINKGSHSEYDRMLRMSNQIWRKGLQKNLNDPSALVQKLSEGQEFKLQRLF